MGIFQGSSIGVVLPVAIAGLVWLGYPLYIRRYFVRKAEIANVASQASLASRHSGRAGPGGLTPGSARRFTTRSIIFH